MEAGLAVGATKQEPLDPMGADALAVDATAKSQQAHPAKVETVPDPPDEDFPDPDEDFPDDDDLDDLDDELDQFIAPTQPQALPKPNTGPTKPSESGNEKAREETMSDEDFTKDFTNEMRNFMKELDDSPDMQSQLEEMISTIQKTAEAEIGGSSASRPGTSASSTAPPKASFKDTIAGLTDQLNNSDKTAKNKVASGLDGSDEEAFLSHLMQNLPMGGALGGEGGSEDDFTNMLLGMMEQLTAKEILYDPMKELSQTFPGWMNKNKEKVSEQDMSKHKEQLKLVNEIVAKFEEPGYSDDDAERRKYIVDRMQAMQATGAVPPDLLGDSQSMQDAFGAEGGCNPQ